VTEFELLKWIHLLAAAVWTGGMIMLAVLVSAIRKANTDIEVLRLMARTFAWVSWTAMAIAIITGFVNYTSLGMGWSKFSLKGMLIVASIALALWHQMTAKRMSPAMRGIGQAVILTLAVAIFGAAVVLV
jgi:putative copper export protein